MECNQIAFAQQFDFCSITNLLDQPKLSKKLMILGQTSKL